MAFSDDGGGFAFACEDAKISICASTWNTRLFQLGRVEGPVFIMTGALTGHDYIARIIGKRPQNIFIIANSRAEMDAKSLKLKFPMVRIVLHKNNNAKVVLVSPDTVWVSSSDFGETKQIESAVSSRHSFDRRLQQNAGLAVSEGMGRRNRSNVIEWVARTGVFKNQWDTLYTMAVKAYDLEAQFTPKQARLYATWRQIIIDKVSTGDGAYLRPVQYDPALSVLFPRLAPKIATGYGRTIKIE